MLALIIHGKRRSYIELELQLGEIERVRTLYQKYLQWAPATCGAWCKYAEVERSLGELARVRAIYELAIEQPVLDMPEVLWKVTPHLDDRHHLPSCTAFGRRNSEQANQGFRTDQSGLVWSPRWIP